MLLVLLKDLNQSLIQLLLSLCNPINISISLLLQLLLLVGNLDIVKYIRCVASASIGFTVVIGDTMACCRVSGDTVRATFVIYHLDAASHARVDCTLV